jgi:hypothetical protein
MMGDDQPYQPYQLYQLYLGHHQVAVILIFVMADLPAYSVHQQIADLSSQQ